MNIYKIQVILKSEKSKLIKTTIIIVFIFIIVIFVSAFLSQQLLLSSFFCAATEALKHDNSKTAFEKSTSISL